jgi:hypothetical protein
MYEVSADLWCQAFQNVYDGETTAATAVRQADGPKK